MQCRRNLPRSESNAIRFKPLFLRFIKSRIRLIALHFENLSYQNEIKILKKKLYDQSPQP